MITKTERNMQSFTICSLTQKAYASFRPPPHSNP